MDRTRARMAAVVAAALIVGGCGSGGGGSTSTSDSRDPEGVMSEFLGAIRQGNEETAAGLLTPLARQKAKEMEMVVAPSSSATATYKILEVEVEGEEAQVATDWTDLDGDGQPHTDRVVWLMRNESVGWRIHGMATRVFPEMPAVIFNFEDPEDMQRKQEQADAEFARRESQGTSEDATSEETGDSTLR